MKIWDKLNGNKTVIGVALMILLKTTDIIFPELIKPGLYEQINEILLLLTGGVGLGHKAVKYCKK